MRLERTIINRRLGVRSSCETDGIGGHRTPLMEVGATESATKRPTTLASAQVPLIVVGRVTSVGVCAKVSDEAPIMTV